MKAVFENTAQNRPGETEAVEATSSRGGFTIVEIAMALVVVAIGVLAVVALLAAGLDASARAVADTQAATFADNVFNGLYASSTRAAEAQTNGAASTNWMAFWIAFTNGSTNITVAAPDMWTNSGGGAMVISGLSSSFALISTNEYRNKSYRWSGATNMVNSTIRYKINASLLTTTNNWTNIARVNLLVWPGKYGGRGKDELPLVFYSEFYNPGDL